jgi:hypothetical protein
MLGKSRQTSSRPMSDIRTIVGRTHQSASEIPAPAIQFEPFTIAPSILSTVWRSRSVDSCT